MNAANIKLSQQERAANHASNTHAAWGPGAKGDGHVHGHAKAKGKAKGGGMSARGKKGFDAWGDWDSNTGYGGGGWEDPYWNKGYHYGYAKGEGKGGHKAKGGKGEY